MPARTQIELEGRTLPELYTILQETTRLANEYDRLLVDSSLPPDPDNGWRDFIIVINEKIASFQIIDP